MLRHWLAQPFLLKLVDLGLVAILIAAPFLMGGRQALGQLALCVLSTFTALAWSLHQWLRGNARWRFTGVEPIMLLGLGLIVLQCCQLSPELINAASPQVTKLLNQWQGHGDLFQGVWQRISFTPSDTWSDLVVIVACLLYFFVAAQRLTTTAELVGFLQVVALGGGAMAAFGLAQYFWSNGKFFWVYSHPMTTTHLAAKGAFTNANHFANYLAMAVPAQMLMIVLRLSQRRVELPREGTPSLRTRLAHADLPLLSWSALLGVTAVGILYSDSLAGIFAVCVGVMVALVIFWQKSMLTLRQAAVGTGLLLVWLASIPALNHSLIQSPEFNSTIADARSIANRCSRQQVWFANMQGVREFPLVGTGLGSHHEVYWLWVNTPQEGVEFSHAENGYLQLALETGLTGLGLVVLLWLTSLLWCAQGLWNAGTPQSKGVMAVVSAGLIVSLVQSVSDFVWYVPACVNLVLLFAICAWRVSLMRFFEPTTPPVKSRGAESRLGRLSWACALPAFACLGYWMVQEKLPELRAEPIWEDYLRMTLSQPSGTDSLMVNVPAEQQRQRTALALAAAQANPKAQRLQLHAGLACLNQFALNQSEQRHQMPLTQIRDAARSLFTSTKEMNQWLDRPGVLGEERKLLEQAMQHFRASIQACPLQPRPYLELAELVWLEGTDGHAERSLVEQAVAARPCDARAQFALGRLLWLNGEHKAAAEHWQFAFRQDAGYRGHLITALAAYVPARFFLDYFEPDHESLKQLRQAYATSDDTTGYQLVLETLAQSSMKVARSLKGTQAEEEWITAHECFAELGNLKNAYQCAKEAVAANPQSYAAHQLFGLWLYRNGYYAEAVDELSWCVQRRAGEAWLISITVDAQRKIDAGESKTRVAEEPEATLVR